MDDLGLLRRAHPFQDVTRAQLEALLPSFRRRSVQAAQHLWQPGNPGDRLWFVMRGQLRIVVTSADGDEIVTQVMGPGESFGQPALFVPGTPGMGTRVTTAESELMSLRRDPLLGFLEHHPAAMRRMLESMSMLILSQASSFREVAFHDVRGRVAYQVLKLAEE
jgi:CRP/FNR family transcriptional regulator, cyclic AMP receptor protein